MQSIFDLYPTATQSSDGISGLVHFPSSSRSDAYSPIIKIDHQFTAKHNVSLRYAYNHSYDPNPFHDEILPNAVGGVNSKQIAQGATAHLTSTLKPTLVNDFAFAWNRLFAYFGCNGTSVLDGVSTKDQFGNGIDYNMGPFTSFGCINLVSDYQWRKTGTLSYGDGLTWSKGSHLFKFGGDFRNVGEQGPNNFFSRRQLSLNAFTGDGIRLVTLPKNNLGNTVDSAALKDAAAALYGFVWQDLAGQFYDKNGVRQATDNKLFRQHEYDWYGQDTWKVRRNLTLIYGLRYQLNGVPYEENANFSNLLTNPGSFQTGQSATFTIVGPGTGHSLYKQDKSNVEPRLGVSWDPWGDGKTAVRGAFGIFHDRVFGNLFGNARGNPPFEQDYFNFPFDVVTGGIPPVAPPSMPQPPTATVADETGLSPVVFDTNFPNLVSNNWNLNIQRQLPGNNVVDIAYVGTESHHLYRQVDGNPPDPALVQQLLATCQPGNPANTTGCTADDVSFTNLYFGAEFGVLPFNAVNNNALFQPPYQRAIGNGVYHGLQTRFTHRMSHGLQLEGAYTWAHSIDNAPDPLVPAAGNRTFPRNSRNLGEERGNSDYDIRHRLVVDYIYELPFGKGTDFLNNGITGKIFEGWQLSGISTLQTGHPFDVFSSTDMERTGLSGRADLVSGQDPYDKNAAGATTYATSPNAIGEKIWFSNPAAFSGRTDGSGAPLYIGPGTVGRNRFYGPSYVNFDMAWSKSTSFGERVKLQLRVECFNIFNHPQFGNPVNGITSSTFGLITGTISQPDGTTSARQIQVGAKLNF
jgi:hypothetical protein